MSRIKHGEGCGITIGRACNCGAEPRRVRAVADDVARSAQPGGPDAVRVRADVRSTWDEA